MGFCPYLRHAHGSDDKLSAVTWHTVFFCWFLLQNDKNERFLAKQELQSFNLMNKKMNTNKKTWSFTSFLILEPEIAGSVKEGQQ